MKNFTLWSGRVLGLLLTAFSLNAQAQFCDQNQNGVPGFPSDPGCEAALCAIDPFCCDTAWDQLCGNAAATLPECSGCLSTNGGNPDCLATIGAGLTVCDFDPASPAYATTIAGDSFCCDSAWDQLCQDAYLANGGLPNPDPACDTPVVCTIVPPACATDLDAVALIQAEDEICCSIEWDDVCQALYDSISNSCGGQLTPGDCAAAVPACVTDLVAYGFVVSLEPTCCEVVWDELCQGFYDSLSATCTGPVDCLAIIPECATDIEVVNFVIANDPFCCETAWDEFCQEDYNLNSSTCLVGTVGCTYPSACNFNPGAAFDDGSCEFISCGGCTYPDALNFNPVASIDNGSCVFDNTNCVDNCPGDFNDDNVVNTSDLLTFLSVFGNICE